MHIAKSQEGSWSVWQHDKWTALTSFSVWRMQRGFRQHGFINLTTYLRTYKVGDYVDVKVNAAIHKVSLCRSLKMHESTFRFAS